MTRINFFNYYHNQMYRLLFRWVDRSKLKILTKAFGIISPGDKILDIGSGDGALASSLRERIKCKNILCMDKNENLLELCTKKGLDICFRDIDNSSSVPKVQGIMLVDVIEHLNDPEKVLKLIKRNPLCKRLVIITPAYDSLVYVLGEKFANLVTGQKSDHINPFTKERIDYLMEKNFGNYFFKRINFGIHMAAIVEFDRS